jgi:hypothetical protein
MPFTKTVKVPHHLVGKIIGKQAKNVIALAKSCGNCRIQSLREHPGTFRIDASTKITLQRAEAKLLARVAHLQTPPPTRASTQKRPTLSRPRTLSRPATLSRPPLVSASISLGAIPSHVRWSDEDLLVVPPTWPLAPPELLSDSDWAKIRLTLHLTDTSPN